ncbi:hypothetical protein RHGRI_012142 [Rhododendron griersonianum]|uniref:CCHC-type domain-containing protein n=1 Tax=Rhododendron griersonianum TaxID=479676 RepID=A0AAV6KPF0_9ERIC|nr:hypothetical protein RHGRI_012142 [Rhododendron griersonianum]
MGKRFVGSPLTMLLFNGRNRHCLAMACSEVGNQISGNINREFMPMFSTLLDPSKMGALPRRELKSALPRWELDGSWLPTNMGAYWVVKATILLFLRELCHCGNKNMKIITQEVLQIENILLPISASAPSHPLPLPLLLPLHATKDEILISHILNILCPEDSLLIELHFQLMMNVENDDVEPVTDLQLSLAQFHQCNPTRLSDSGAGITSGGTSPSHGYNEGNDFLKNMHKCSVYRVPLLLKACLATFPVSEVKIKFINTYLNLTFAHELVEHNGGAYFRYLETWPMGHELKDGTGQTEPLSSSEQNAEGLNKTNPEASPLAHRNNDPKSTNVGFQSIFQSICCSNTKEQQETKMSNSTNTLSANIVADPETCRTSSCSDQNRASFNLVSNSVKESDENVDSNAPAEAKVIKPLRSFWITRFSPKTPPPVLHSNSCDRNVNAALECSVDYARKLIPSKELQKYAPDAEASFGFKRVSGNNSQKTTFKSNPRLSSPKLKNSEAMASVFARRLDALKHIVPPDVENNTILKVETCFYCGRSGHILRDCLEITEIERENLMRNQCLYDGAEESPCFCIRCFQLDHWAISCPVASATSRSHSRVPDARANCDVENHGPDIGKHVGSSSVDNELKEKLITPLCKLVKRKFSDMPKGVFNAIRNLRLSRTDVLKWMNSHTSSLHLDGFFLRLRLGKWEEHIGGTGYHVACITGEQREKSPQGSKKPISVNIGGIRCLVETQYISNQDFLEDELMAWWCATQKSGGKVPSEDHLRSKLQERKMLGI